MIVASSFKKLRTVQATVEAADLTGGADTLKITIDPQGVDRAFYYTVQIRTAAGVAKITALTSVYVRTGADAGKLTIADAAAEFVTGDIITVLGTLA
jgi:hypothetical protein